jgi:transposase
VRAARLWARLVGVEGAVIQHVWFDEQAGAVVVTARPRKHLQGRCGVCGRRCPGFDRGEGCRRWRALDLGTVRAFVEADAPRVRCPEHGVVVVAVPWARHGARHPRGFDDAAAWLAVHTSKQAVGQLLRIAWETVGRVVARVAADAEAACDRFDGLRRIGIDEISYKKGHKYLTVVVDHDRGRLVWAAPGRDAATWASSSTPSAPSAVSRSGWSAPTRRSGSR